MGSFEEEDDENIKGISTEDERNIKTPTHDFTELLEQEEHASLNSSFLEIHR